jgi:hypothetical protein
VSERIILDPPVWAPVEKVGPKRDKSQLRINKSNISLSGKVWAWMGQPERLRLGVSRLPSSCTFALTMRPDPKGHKVGTASPRPCIINPSLTARLHALGLEYGDYDVCRHKREQLFVAIPRGG